MHNVRGQCKFRNDLAKSPESNEKHENKDEPWIGVGVTPVALRDPNKPTKTEETDYTKHVKEKNERFMVCLDNTKKAHSLLHGCCNEAMQTQLENDTEQETKIEGDPFVMPEKTKLKMCNPSKVKCPCVTSFEQLERPPNKKQEDNKALIECTK